MPSTSKSKQRKGKKLKFDPKQQKRNWLDLPPDVMANILYRVGVVDILENAQKVCTAWHKICKDPAMWRVIYMDNFGDPRTRPPLREMCKHAVDRSQGQLVDITLVDFADDELIQYIAQRSSQVKRLQIECCYGGVYHSLTESQVLKKFPLLEELSLCMTEVSKEAIESAGRYCPKLKTLKLNHRAYNWYGDMDEESIRIRNEIAVAIAENLPELRHLELIGSSMANIGLQKILDGCSQLESLDLRLCLYIDLKGDIGKRCSQQIKCLKLPDDSLEGCPYHYGSGDEFSGYLDHDDYPDFYDAYNNDNDKDDYTAFYIDYYSL